MALCVALRVRRVPLLWEAFCSSEDRALARGCSRWLPCFAPPNTLEPHPGSGRVCSAREHHNLLSRRAVNTSRAATRLGRQATPVSDEPVCASRGKQIDGSAATTCGANSAGVTSAEMPLRRDGRVRFVVVRSRCSVPTIPTTAPSGHLGATRPINATCLALLGQGPRARSHGCIRWERRRISSPWRDHQAGVAAGKRPGASRTGWN